MWCPATTKKDLNQNLPRPGAAEDSIKVRLKSYSEVSRTKIKKIIYRCTEKCYFFKNQHPQIKKEDRPGRSGPHQKV